MIAGVLAGAGRFPVGGGQTFRVYEGGWGRSKARCIGGIGSGALAQSKIYEGVVPKSGAVRPGEDLAWGARAGARQGDFVHARSEGASPGINFEEQSSRKLWTSPQRFGERQ